MMTDEMKMQLGELVAKLTAQNLESLKKDAEFAQSFVGKYVMVTTIHRGVFAGFVQRIDDKADSLQLRECRMCVYWSEAMQGVGGLTDKGPDDDCKIGRAIPTMNLPGITSICEMTKEAQANWERGPWKKG